jgi:hypothetical protein
MRRNASGVWESVANNVPRLHYPVGVGCPSWLNEPQRTNNLNHSTDFANAYWSLSNVSISNESVANPFDASTVQRIQVIANSSTGTGFSRAISSINSAFSLFIKKGNRRYIGLVTQASLNATIFDLDNGVVQSLSADHLAARITPESFGWFRIEVAVSSNVGNTEARLRFFTDALAFGGSAGDFHHVYQAQLEAGANATSPLITAGSALTRLADSVVLINAGTLIGQTEGVILCEFNFSSGVNAGRIGGISNIDLTNRLVLNIVNTDKIQVIARANNAIFFNIISTIALVNGLNRVAIAYQSGNLALYINGVLANTSTDAFTFSALVNRAFPFTNEIDTTASSPLLGSVFYLAQTRLPNAQVAALTTL